MLLEKMAYIMRNRGRVDNENSKTAEYSKRYVTTLNIHSQIFNLQQCFSLNREKRERELLRVAKENQEVLRRILQKKADYDNVEMDKSWRTNLKYMDNISSYPNRWWTMSRSGTRASKAKSRADNRSGKSFSFSIHFAYNKNIMCLALSERAVLPPIRNGETSNGR